MYEGKSLNKSNATLKCMIKYAKQKSYFGIQNGSLAICHIGGRDEQAVGACAVGRTTWPLHCQLAPWKSKEALFVFCGQRV